MGMVETTQEPCLKGAVCQAVDPAVDLLQGCGKRSVAFTPAPHLFVFLLLGSAAYSASGFMRPASLCCFPTMCSIQFTPLCSIRVILMEVCY